MPNTPEKKPVEELANELVDATKKAQDLAVEVRDGLRKSRTTSLPATNDPKKP